MEELREGVGVHMYLPVLGRVKGGARGADGGMSTGES